MVLATHLSQGRTFYGWYIVGVAFLTSLTMAGTRLLALSIFLKPMVAALEWNRAQYALFASLGHLVSSFLIAPLGPLIDRRGVRDLLVWGAVLSGGGFMALGLVREPWHFALVLIGPISLGLTGMSSAVANVAVANWFVRKRGRAVALGTLGLPTAAILYPPLIGLLITTMGWRWAWAALGLLVWVLMILPPAFIVKRRPEDMGLQPDGESRSLSAAALTGAPTRHQEPVWTTRQIAATSAIWVLCAAFGLFMLGLGLLMFHLMPYLTDVGFSLRMATNLLVVWGIADLVGRLPWGLLIERAPVKYCAVIAFLATAVAVLSLMLAGNHLAAAIGALTLFGLAITGTVPMQEVLFANYYGRPSLGRVRGIAMPVISLASAIGSPLAGYIFDITGSYNWAFVLAMAFFVLGSGFLFLARPPRHPG